MGKNDAGKFNQSWITLRVISDSDFKSVCNNVKASVDKITSKNYVEDQKICLLETEREEKGVQIKCFWKIVESRERRKVYELKISVLKVYEEDYAYRTNEMIESFTVK